MAIRKIGNLLSQIKNQITRAVKEKILRPFTANAAKKIIQEKKQQMLADFNNLPVVEALDYGPGYGNNDFAGILNGYGDLFSFLGFPRNKKPTNKIRTLIKAIKLAPASSPDLSIIWEAQEFPTIGKIEEATKNELPWIKGKSWVTYLEQGVPGLGSYLNKDNLGMPPSYSHYGIQSQYSVRKAGVVKADKWMTGFLEKWRKEFETADT